MTGEIIVALISFLGTSLGAVVSVMTSNKLTNYKIEELKKEVQDYVKSHTAPYKYPRIVEFRTELPKTISGQIPRNKL